MKLYTFRTGTLAIVFAAGLFVTACKSDSTNAANNDTVASPVEPQPDNATVKPDTMTTIAPQTSPADSTNKKQKMK